MQALTRRGWGTKLLIFFGAVIALLVAGEAYLMVASAAYIPAKKTRVEFSSSGIPSWYEISSSSRVTPIPGAALLGNGSLVVLEQKPAPVSGQIMVLARSGSDTNITAGITGVDLPFMPVATSTADKSGLAVYGNVAVFSETAPLQEATSSIVMIEGKEVEIRNAPSSPEVLTHTLYTLTLDKKVSPRSLGNGRAAHFLENGSLIALASEGLVRIDTQTLKREVLLARGGADAAGSAISDEGAAVVFYDAVRKTLTFYARESTDPLKYSLRGVAAGVDALDTAFIGTSELLVLSPNNTAFIYPIPASTEEIVKVKARLSVAP